MYCALSKDTIRYGTAKRDVFDISLRVGGSCWFNPETTKYAPLKNNKASFEKDNFVFECERITIKVPVQNVPETK